jgi:CheY-like chemotaxis protein
MKTPTSPRVLYAEDNEDSLLMISTLLGLYDIEVFSAKTAKDAYQLATKEHFDLYLLDMRLPDANGLDLCRQLRRLDPVTPIVFYSANAFDSDEKKGLAAGANIYLKKPFVDDLTLTIQHLIIPNSVTV